MKAEFLALAPLLAMGLAVPALAQSAAPSSGYKATVDPSVFQKKAPLEHKKLGATVDPASLRLITPGVDKFTIYRLIGPPHFGEGITRRWNYVLFFPPAKEGAERMRCRMEIRFERQRGRYSVTVSDVIWQDQSCVDRVAAAS